MFKILSQAKYLDLLVDIADLKRELNFFRAERAHDESRLGNVYDLENARSEMSLKEARYKAEAEAKAANAKASYAENYAEKSVKMAANCAADFANATGKLVEQFTEMLTALKPEAASLTVLPFQPSSVNVAADCGKKCTK